MFGDWLWSSGGAPAVFLLFDWEVGKFGDLLSGEDEDRISLRGSIVKGDRDVGQLGLGECKI